MPADANIFQQYLQAPKSVVEYQTEQDQRDALRQRNALQALALQQQNDQVQQGMAERNALRRIAAASGGSRDALISGLRNSGLPGLMTQADALEQSGAKLSESQSIAAKNNAEASSKKQADEIKARQDAYAEAAALNTPEDAMAAMSRAVTAGKVPMQVVPAFQRMVTTDPLWKLKLLQGALDPEKLKEALLPHFQAAGGALVNTNPMAGPTGQGQPNAIPITESADAKLQARTSRENNSANIRKDLTIAGLAPDGSSGVNQNVEQMAQAIAAGRAAPITGFALAKPQGQTVMRRVFEINPNYDETTYAAKTKAARDFSTGQQGNAMRSFNVAGQHLDQLGTLVDALDNGNMQLINRAANFYKEQTGQTAPTNFDAAKDVVSKEVVKAIVAGGGGVAERQELADLMSKAKSPAQLKGVITQYRNLMAAQHDALLQQRRAAGLTDDTLPNYDLGGHSGAGAADPLGIRGGK